MFDDFMPVDSALVGGPEEWTADDDALLAALTEAAWAETDWSSPAQPPEVPVEVLAAIVGGPGVSADAGMVEVLRAQARLVAHHQARLVESMVAIVDGYAELTSDLAEAMEGAVGEVRAALSLTRRAAEADLDLAWTLRQRLPQVLAALRSGRLDLRRARVIADGTGHLDEATARSVADHALTQAEGRTTGQLRQLIHRLCIETDPDDAERRRRSALADRCLIAELGDDSTATIIASDLPPDRVAAAMDRIDRMARSLRRPAEERSIDQLRADVFLDLLEGTSSGPPSGTVDIRVDLTTLIGLDERAAELGGYGPVVADIARQMSERFGVAWRIGVTDGSGRVVHSGITRRRPTSAYRRAVEVRDQTCVFPGCRMPASSCDLDHRIRVVDGGVTHPDQLVPLCRHDHVIRHRFDWTHVRNPDGSHTWTSPLGVEYERPPPI
jgi:RES domain-containing protein